MTINDADKLLVEIRGRGAVNMLQRYSVGTIKEAIRTIFKAKTATRDMFIIAEMVEATILRHQYRNA